MANIKKKIPFIILLFQLCVVEASYAEEQPKYSKIIIQGDKTENGIFDLSVEHDENNIGWMVYSRVSIPEYVSSHLARSSDKGATWRYVSTINKSYAQNVRVKGKNFNGVWRYETPSIVYDPTDIPQKRWKLFVQKYYALPPFKNNAHALMGEGWIEYKTAQTPEGPWSKPVCLFGHKKHNCLIQPNSLHPSLSKNFFYNEIGMLAHKGILYMSADASTTPAGLGKWKTRTVVLFSSKDHGKSWRYNGVLTNYDDAEHFGYVVLTGSSLIEHKGKPYLLITPSGKKGLFAKNRGHDGCYLIAFNNIDKAKLKRDENGNLKVIKSLSPEHNTGGLCDYHEQNSKGGLMLSQINMKDRPDVFGVYNTRMILK